MSGLEQNSFFFRQASLLGMTHLDALMHCIKSACQRNSINLPPREEISKQSKCPVYVLFGSHNAERQVSLMSGTNVWLKLQQSNHHEPIPFLIDHQGDIWELPYSYTLNHTVEEIYANCIADGQANREWSDLIEFLRKKLGILTIQSQEPRRMTLDSFFVHAKQNDAFIFIAMHGGIGENGTLQSLLEKHQILYNGSNPQASALCIDKYLTGIKIQEMGDPDIFSVPKTTICLTQLLDPKLDFKTLWEKYCQELNSSQLIIKPRSDGCSAGIVLLKSATDFQKYCRFFHQKVQFIPPFSFANQSVPIEMPSAFFGDFLLEPYIETDEISIQNHQLKHIPKNGWIELTVGILENGGVYRAFNPSITVAEGSILSLEEKFQGGTGINLTPPPEEIISFSATQKIKGLVAKAAKELGIQNYARVDIFFNRVSEKMIIIEANTLPGLTPSTVIYHQALAEEPSLTPLALLEKIIASKLASHKL